jgi:hypothetical protein
VLVSESGTYFWVASYSGNQNNNVFETECGDEITEILAKDDLPRDDFFVTLANFAEFG